MSNLKDSVSRTVLVALVLCVVCSVIVSAAAVMLRDCLLYTSDAADE